MDFFNLIRVEWFDDLVYASRISMGWFKFNAKFKFMLNKNPL